MFSFIGKHRRLLLGIGAVGAGFTAYYQTLKRHQMRNMAYCDSKYIAKKPEYERLLIEKYQCIPYFEKERKGDWVKETEKEGCVVSKLTVPYSDFFVIKGQMKTKTKKSVKEIMRLVTEVAIDKNKRSIYKKLDPDNIYYNVLHTFEKNKKFLCHGRWTANSWVVSDRDLVVLRDTKVQKNDYGVMYGGSVKEGEEEEGFYPVDKDCVRSTLNNFYWQVKRIDDETVEVTYTTHTDPRGSIPTFVYNMVATNQAMGCLRYVKLLIQD